MVGLKDMIDGWIEGMIDGWIEGQGSGGLVFPRFCVVSLRCVAPCRPCCRAAAFPLPPARSLARAFLGLALLLVFRSLVSCCVFSYSAELFGGTMSSTRKVCWHTSAHAPND